MTGACRNFRTSAPVREFVPRYRALDYQVVLAPKATPRAVLDEIYARSLAGLSPEDMRKQFLDKGAEVALLNPDDTLAFMKEDLAAIGEACKAAGIVAE